MGLFGAKIKPVITETSNIPLDDCISVIHQFSSKIIVYSRYTTNKVEVYDLKNLKYCYTIDIYDQEVIIHNIVCDQNSSLFAIAASAKPLYGDFSNPSDSFFIYDIETEEKVLSRRAHMDSSIMEWGCYDCDISTKAGIAISVGRDHIVNIYNLFSGDLIKSINCRLNAKCSLSSDGTRIVTSGEDIEGSVAIIELSSPIEIYYFKEINSFVTSVKINPDSLTAIIANDIGEVILIDLARRKVVSSFKIENEVLNDVISIRNNQYFITSCCNGAISVRDAKNGELLLIKIEGKPHCYISCLSDGTLLLYGDGEYGGINIASIDWGDENQDIVESRMISKNNIDEINVELYKNIQSDYGLDYIEINSDGTKILTAGDTGQIQLWDRESASLIRELTINTHIQLISFIENSPVIVTTGQKTVKLIYLEKQNRTITYNIPQSYIHLVCLATDKKSIYVLSDTNSNGVVLNRMSSIEETVLYTKNNYIDSDLLYDLTPKPGVIRFSEDEKRIYLKKKNIIVISTDSGKQVGSLSTHPGIIDLSEKVNSAYFYDNGLKALITHGANIRIWDPQRIETLLLLERVPSENESCLYTGREKVSLWKDSDHDGTGKLYCAVLSPDHQIIATGGEGGSITLYDFKKREKLISLPAHSVRTISLSFDNKGKFLYSIGNKGELKIWKILS